MIPDSGIKNNYAKLILSLTTAIHKLRLYPPGHPSAIYSIKSVYSILSEILNTKDEFSISLSADSQILIEGYSVGEKGSKSIEELHAYFKKLDIESLTFNSGITDAQLDAFIRILLMEPEELKKIGDFNKLFLDRNIRHIKIAQFSYIKVEKGKTVLEIDKGRKAVLEKTKTKLKDYSRGRIQSPEQIQVLQRDVIDLVITEVKEKKKLSIPAKNMLKRFLLSSKDRKKVYSVLNHNLLDSGWLPEEADKLVDKIEEEISKRPTGGMTKVTRLEIDKLKKENEELKLRVTRTQKEIDLQTTAYEQLKQKSKRVLRDKERVDSIVHHMAEGLVVVDSQGKIMMLNPVAEKLLGVSKDNTGEALSSLVKDEHLLTLVKNIVPDKEEMVPRDVELLSPDESTKRVLRTSSAVVEDHNGKTVGMVTVLNDITRQREIEKMKSAFVANVSHELRTPLATIQQNISLLMEGLPGGLNDTQRKFLNMAQANIKRLKRLINDLLDSAAIEAGKFKVNLSKVEINERISNVIAFLSGWAQTKNISIHEDLLPKNEVLEMDQDKIEQVLTNLLSNAIKFTPDGGEVFVSVNKKKPTQQLPHGAIEISVRDTGAGIAADNINKVFEKFERAKAVVSGVGGTGLGLSICKEIVRMHGGKIWLESKLNEGSKFSFWLPSCLETVFLKEV